ncbi:hypothetical protein ABEB36_009138 [Hypothenemus hampei]|uniref:Protein SAAL1 n=1 Tax=Hypothenemus hampei TaxID=57062 RepID=A0ABD1EP95_HYPHA
MESQISNNINADELDEETKEKLKGDKIGDTLYSESFVLKTLLSLSNLKYTEEEEQDLCFLWDMTLEKDVCQLLFRLNYPTLATATLVNCVEPRFIEILIGILANILVEDCEKMISEQEIKLVMNEFKTSDTEVLKEILRFIESITYFFPQHLYLIEDEETMQQMEFILKNSQNRELISRTMHALVRLTDDFQLISNCVNNNLFNAVIEGFDTLFSSETQCLASDFIIGEESKQMLTFFNLITNTTMYANEYNNYSVLDAIGQSHKLSDTISRIFKYFSEETNLFPVHENFERFINDFDLIIFTANFDINNSILDLTLNSASCILFMLRPYKSDVLSSYNAVLNFLGHLIYTADPNLSLNVLKQLKYNITIVVLNSLRENSKTFDFNISKKLTYLYSKFK